MHKKKTLLIFLLATLFLPTVLLAQKKPDYARKWNHKLMVEEADVPFGANTYHSYRISVFETDNNQLKTLITDWVKKYSKEVSGDNPITVNNATVKAIQKEPIQMKIKMEPGAGDDSYVVSVAYLPYGKAIGATSDVDVQKNVRAFTRDMAVKLNREIVQKQVDAQKDKTKAAQKEYDRAQKEVEKAKSKNRKGEKKITKNAQSRKDIDTEIAQKQKAIDAYSAKIENNRTPDNVKKLAGMQSDFTKLQSKKTKLLSQEVKGKEGLNTVQDKIPDATKEMNAKKKIYDDQKALLTDYQSKLKDIR